MVREWTVAQRTFLVEKKMQGADLAQIITDEAWLTHFFHFFLLGETSSILRTAVLSFGGVVYFVSGKTNS